MGNSKSRSDIMEASMRGDIEIVEACLKRKEDPNKRNELGQTPLMIASLLGHFDVVKLLIQYKAQVNLSPLDYYGAKGEDIKASTHNVNSSILQYCQSRSLDIKLIGLYLYAGVVFDWTSLLHASFQGHVNVVKLLVENGAQIDIKDTGKKTALYWASKNGHLEVVQFLLEKGAAVDPRNNEGLTPLIVASQNGHLNVVLSLLQNGANIEHVAKCNLTPLLASIRAGSSDVVRALIKNGANVNKKKDNEFGLTPLHECCALGHSEIITVLLDGGANINAINNVGKSALDLAIEKRNSTISDILLDRGAKFGNDIQNEELREKVSKMNDRLKRFQDELISLQNEKDQAVNEKMEEIAKLKKKYEEEIARLKKKQQEDADAKEVCSIALDLLIEEEDRKSDEISFLEKKLNESKEEWDLVMEEKKREFEELQGKMTLLTKDRQLLKVANSTLLQDFEELQRKMSELTKDRQLLKVENTTLLEEVEKLKKDLEQAKADLKSVTTGPLFKDCTIKVEKGSSLVVQSNA